MEEQETDGAEYLKKHGIAIGEFLIQECISKDEESMYYCNEAVNFGSNFAY